MGLRVLNNAFGHYITSPLYERKMEIVHANLQWESCLIYLDDVIACGTSFDEEAEIYDEEAEFYPYGTQFLKKV